MTLTIPGRPATPTEQKARIELIDRVNNLMLQVCRGAGLNSFSIVIDEQKYMASCNNGAPHLSPSPELNASDGKHWKYGHFTRISALHIQDLEQLETRLTELRAERLAELVS